MYFFSNPLGIIIALVFLGVALFMTALFKELSLKATIVTGMGYFSWYIVTLVIVKYFPMLKVLSKNKVLYAIVSIILLEVITNFIIDGIE